MFTMVQLSAGFLVLLLGQLPAPIEAKGFSPGVQKDTLLATVRIINQKKNDSGTGVLLKSGYVLTAAHVVEGADEVEVHVYGADTYPEPSMKFTVRILAYSKDRRPDLALLQQLRGVKGGLDICPVKNAPVAGGEFLALAGGCGIKKEPTLRQLTVSVVDTKKSNEAVLTKYLQSAAKSIKGESGGPLINAKGQLIGICSFTSGDHGYFCTPREIHGFLKDHRYGELVKEP